MISRYIKVNIDRENPPTNSGVGTPLIFEGKATTAIPYTECADINEVIKVVGGITESDNEETIATKTETAKASNIYKAALLYFMQNNAPAPIAICATTEVATTGLATVLYHNWRQLIVVSSATEGEDTRKAISNYIETTDDKLYFTSVKSVSEITGDNAIEGNDRTIILCHEDEDTTVVFPEAALVGATAGSMAGSITYAFKELKGLTAKFLSGAEIDAIHDAHAICYIAIHGMSMTSEGRTTNDTYVDIIDAEDYVKREISYRTLQVLVAMGKVPYDNAGITILENVCVNVLKECANNGIIALTDAGVPDFSVSYKPRSNTATADRAARRYIEGSFRFALAGAIHSVEVNGTIEI